MDVLFLYFLLPKFGMQGYFFSFFVTHLVNFVLSLRRLLIITGETIPFSVPALSVAAALAAGWGASHFGSPVLRAGTYPILLGCLMCLFGFWGGRILPGSRGFSGEKPFQKYVLSPKAHRK